MIRSARIFLTGLKTGWLREPLIPVLVIVVLAGIWGFLELASEVMEKETRQFDEAVLLAMREPGNPSDPVGSKQVEEMARDLTALGGVTLLTGVTLVSFGIALFAGRVRLAVAGVVSVLSGSIIQIGRAHV